jgi:hypothetical protein
MANSGKCSWRFVDVNEVAPGPWRSLGSNNHFVHAQQQQKVQAVTSSAARLQELRRMRDEYFKQNGSGQYQNR